MEYAASDGNTARVLLKNGKRSPWFSIVVALQIENLVLYGKQPKGEAKVEARRLGLLK